MKIDKQIRQWAQMVLKESEDYQIDERTNPNGTIDDVSYTRESASNIIPVLNTIIRDNIPSRLKVVDYTEFPESLRVAVKNNDMKQLERYGIDNINYSKDQITIYGVKLPYKQTSRDPEVSKAGGYESFDRGVRSLYGSRFTTELYFAYETGLDEKSIIFSGKKTLGYSCKMSQ